LWRGWEGIARCLISKEPEQAIQAYQRALRLKPERMSLWLELGNLYTNLRNWEAALKIFAEAKKKTQPNHIMLTLQAKAYWMMGHYEESVTMLREAVKLQPKNTTILNNLAKTLEDVYEISEALTVVEELLAIEPDNSEALTRKGSLYWRWGRVPDAITSLNDALRLKPDDLRLKQMIAYACLHDEIKTPQEQASMQAMPFVEVEGTRAEVFPSVRHETCPHIGFVTPDFQGDHPMAQFMQTYFAYCDKTAFRRSIFYSNEQFDRTAESFKRNADAWHDITRMSDRDAATYIQNQQVDLLIDLAGHSANNRLNLFHYRPSSLQGSFLGYPSTTGSPFIDILFADENLCPASREHYYSERLMHVKGGIFGPPFLDESLPTHYAGEKESIVFGNFSRCSKYSPKTVQLWAKAVSAIPKSTLLLKSGSFYDEHVKNYWYEVF